MEGKPKPWSFDKVYREECKEIRERRKTQAYQNDSPEGAPRNLVGLALSGGGVRSATFCLGFLQGLHGLGLLRIFDYLSTVSGGGYVGGWWSAWLSRERQIKPLVAGDIKDPDGLIRSLREAKEGTAADLRRRLGPNAMELIRLYPSVVPGPDRDRLIGELLSELNRAACELDPVDYEKWVQPFLSEGVRPLETPQDIFPPAEKIESERAPQQREGRGQKDEGSSSAWIDPLHHLRLFASYLTPRRGALSADTWRAVSVITRNLALTWLVLLPVLMVIVLFGQLYFRLAPRALKSLLGVPDGTAFDGPLLYLLIPVLALLVLIVVITIVWLIDNPDRPSLDGMVVHLICIGAVLFLVYAGLDFYLQRGGVAAAIKQRLGGWGWLLLLIPVLLVLSIILPASSGGVPNNQPELKREWRRQVRHNRLSRVHGKLMTWMVLLFIVLLISGYGHRIVAGVFSSGTREFSLGKLGLGLLPLLTAVAGSIFTAFKASPSGGGDTPQPRDPSLISRIVFAVTPGLMIIMLALGAAWLGGHLLNWLDPGWTFLQLERWLNLSQLRYEQIRPVVTVAILCGIMLCFALAVYEMSWPKLDLSLRSSVFSCLAVFTFYWTAREVFAFAESRQVPFLVHLKFGGVGVLVIPLIVAGLIPVIFFFRVLGGGRWRRGYRRMAESRRRPGQLIISILPFLCFVLIVGGVFVLSLVSEKDLNLAQKIYPMMVIVAALAGSMILFRMFVVRPDRKNDFKLRPRWRRKKVETESENLWGLASVCLAVPLTLGYFLHTPVHHDEPYQIVMTFLFFILPLAALPYLLVFLKSLADAHVGQYVTQPHGLIDGEQGGEARGGRRAGFFGKALGVIFSEKKSQEASRLFVGVVVVTLLTVSYGVPTLRQTSVEETASLLWPTMTLPAFVISLIFATILSVVLLGLSSVQARERRDEIDAGGEPENGWGLQGEGTDSSYQERKLAVWGFSILCVAAAVSVGLMSSQVFSHVEEIVRNIKAEKLASLALAGLLTCFTLSGFEIWWGKGDNRRSLWLLLCNYVTLSILFLLGISMGNYTTNPGLLAALGVLAAALVWVMALGWMVDPNMVSMHQFYKGRLVRAYLGASNATRFHQNKDIAEAVAGDDIHLKELKNCQRGAPYHLINTTLNLVAGRDLATAQRSASSFVLSKKFCGSPRTSYRPTKKYMDGRLTVGTAVAASGAAVSPSMGAKKPTAALAMLMTLLNVRLGYWAPTPNKERWKSSQPRLWPFYLLREFTSQTNDLSTYCYLTDGGHFDNTGLYSLVERGCRFIVMVDCTADPKPCFQDLGDAIRRCRIDFGAEINLPIEPLINNKEKGGGKKEDARCFVVGTITYSEQHAAALNPGRTAGEADEDSRVGVIVYVKPSMVDQGPADVRQYAIENSNFPQQATTNQWFDEAQFESYRRLGQSCAETAFGGLRAVAKVKGDGELSPDGVRRIFHEAERGFNNKPSYQTFWPFY